MKPYDKFAAIRPRKRMLGHRKNGQPIWAIGGASPEGDPPDEDGNDADDGDGGDPDADEDDGDLDLLGGDDAGEGDGDGADDDDLDDAMVDRIAERLESRLESRFDSIADRRVNALLKDRQRPAKKTASRQSSQPDRSADLREARAVYREFVGDEVGRFLGSEEREFAADLAASMLQREVSQGIDPEVAGRSVAKAVAQRVKDTRKMYERQTLSVLESRGALNREKLRVGQPKTKGTPPGTESVAKKGEDRAREMFPDRFATE